MQPRWTAQPLTGPQLTAALRAIGVRVGGARAQLTAPPSPEHVLASAVAEALPHDYRLLRVTTTWIGVHGAKIHVSELARILPVAEANCSDRRLFRAYWAGIAHWLRSDSRWSKIAQTYRGRPAYFHPAGDEAAKLMIQHRGEDPRFAGSRLRLPMGVLRDRREDVDPPELLAQIHPWYRERVRQGPTYRADCWAELERKPELTAAELARRVGCTYPVAHHALKDWQLVA